MKANLLTILMLLLVSTSAWGTEGDAYYTLTCSKQSSPSGYSTYADVTINGLQWNIPGNATIGAYWRIGGQNLSNVDRTITGKSKVGQVIGKVTLNHSGVSNATLVVNSISLIVSSKSDFSVVTETVTINSPSISATTAGSVDFEPTGDDWAKDSYYKIIFNVSNSNTSKNYGLDITSLVFYEGNTGPACTDPATPLSITSASSMEAGSKITLSTAGGNGKPISWNITSGGDCVELNGTTLTATKAGSVTVQAVQEKDDDKNVCGATVSQTITIANKLYNVTWTSNGEQIGDVVQVESGSKVTTVPADPTAPEGKTFMGWTKIGVTDSNTAPKDLFKTASKSPEITETTEFKAVFATQSGPGNTYGRMTCATAGISDVLKDGTKIIITNFNAQSKALSSTESSTTGQFNKVDVTLSDEVVTSPGDGVIWTVSVASGKYKLQNGDKFLTAYKYGTAYYLQLSNSDATGWTITNENKSGYSDSYDLVYGSIGALNSVSTTTFGARETAHTQYFHQCIYVQQVSYTGYTTSVGEKVAKPTFSIESGTHFKDGQSLSVELSCSTDGAEIRYTTDGNDPTSESSLYNGAISVTKKTTIKAIGIKQGLSNSQIASATYYCDYIATFSVPEGKTAPASIEGSTIIMPAAPVEKCNGYTFQGWARTTKSGTSTTPSDMTAAGGEYEMDKTRIFYAVYQNSDDSKYYTGFTCLTPTLSAPPALVIGKSKIGQTRVVNINLTGSNIIGTTTLAISGANADKFDVEPKSIDAPDGGSLAQVVSISYTPTAKQEDEAILTISSTDAAPIVVALSGEGTNMTFRRYLTKCKPTVFFDVNDVVEHYAEIDNDGHVPAYTPVGTCSGKHFIGWSETQVDELQQTQPTLINFATKVFEPSDPAAGITVYAVFASPNGGKQAEEESVLFAETFETASPIYSSGDSKTSIQDLSSSNVNWKYIYGLATNLTAAKYGPKESTNYMRMRAYRTGDAKNGQSYIQTAEKISDFYRISADIWAENTAVMCNFEYSMDGTLWYSLKYSKEYSEYGGIPCPNTYTLMADTMSEAKNAYVRVRFDNANATDYWVSVDNITIYTKPRTYWYSDYSTNCDKALSATLTYDANGGAPTPAQTSEMGSNITLPNASSTSLECYTLAGWQVQDVEIPEEGENIYFFAPGDKYLLNHNVTLVAQWEKDLVTPAATLVFHKGYNNTEEVIVNCHSTAGDIEAIRPECAAGEGFEFVGWTRTQLPAEGQVDKPELFNIAKEITSISAETINLYPVWNGGVLTGTDYTAGATGNYVIAAEVSDGIWVAIPNAPIINEKGKISGDTIKVGTTDGVKYVLEGDAEGYTWTISNNDGKGQRFFDGTYYIYPTGGGSNTSSNISRGKTGDAVNNYGWTVSHNTYWEIASTDGTTTPATVNTKGLIYRTTDGYGFGQYAVGAISATYKEVRILPIYSYDGKYMPTPECRSIINAESISGLVSMKDATVKTTGRLSITKMYGPAMAGEITGDDAAKFAVAFGEKYTESECEYIPYTVSYTPTAIGETATATITFDDGSGNTWTAESEGQHPSITVRGKAVPSTFVITANVNGKYIALPENTTSSAGAVSGAAIKVGSVGGQMTAVVESDTLNYTMTGISSDSAYQHLSSHTAPFYANASGLRSASGGTAKNYDWVISLNDDGSVRMKAAQGETNPVTYNSTSGNFVTTVGESTAGSNYFRDLYLLPTVTESGDEMDIVDWSTDGSKITSLTVNMNGYTTSGIEAALNGAAEMTALTDVNFSGDQPSAGDATFAVNGTMTSGDLVRLQIHWDSKAGEDVSDRFYRVPYIYAGEDATISSELTPYDIIVIKSGKATVAANTTAHNVYVYPGAELVIDNGATLTCDNLYLRTRPFSAAIFQNNGTLTCGQVYYTRYTADKSAYYHITLPFASTIANMRLTTGQSLVHGKKWQLKEYDAAARAESGKGSNWKVFDGEQMQACVGYQMLSGSAKYREYCFPVAYTKVALGAKVAVTAYTGTAAEKDAMNGGWNHIGLPYTGIYTTNYDDPSEGLKLAVLDNDNVNFYQTMPKEINPAQPFYYQTSATGDLVFGEKTIEPKKAVPAYLAARKAEPARTQWIQLFLTDSKGKRDEANIFTSPSKFTDDYETGYDVGKMTGDGSRVELSINLICGNMAFAAIPDATASGRVPLTVNMPQAGTCTFSMTENNYLGRLEHVYLIDEDGDAIRDLLTQTYEVAIEQTGEITGRFFLNCVFKTDTPTDLDQLRGEGNGPEKIIYNEHFYIIDNQSVYDGTGSRVK